jgi:hypothetical protein
MADEEEQEKKYELYVQHSDKPREEGSQKYSGFGRAYYVTSEALPSDTYEGQFVEGFRRGRGVYTWKKNGDCYQGNYMENKKHGFGKMVYTSKTGDEEEGADPDESAPPRGGTYLGIFTAGQRGCGPKSSPEEQEASKGTFTYVNGDVYTGQWRLGKKHGSGSYTYAKDQTQLVGEWDSGKITNGTWIFPNGTRDCGGFRYNKPYGKGVWITRDGSQLTGEYVQKEQEDPDAAPPDDDEEGKPRPDPKVWCYFKHGKNTTVRGGTMFKPKPQASAI